MSTAPFRRRSAIACFIVSFVLLTALSPARPMVARAEAEAAQEPAAACDPQQLAESESYFSQLNQAEQENPGSIPQEELQAAAARYIADSERCYQTIAAGQAPDGPVYIDDDGLWAPGYVFADYELFGTKWGAGSPFNREDPPYTAGGTVTYSFMNNGVSLSAEDGSPGSNVAITSLPTYQPCFLTDIRSAFAAWSAVADIQFVEVADGGQPFDAAGAVGDIRIGAHTMNGPLGTLAHAYFPPPNGDSAAGDLHFDKQENWTCDISGIDIGLVALHEVGHTIGMSHESGVPAIMNGYYDETLTGLQPDDIVGARAIYGADPALHCGTIGADTTWTSADNMHVVSCDVTVAPGVTLTIEHGAIVKFKAGRRLFVQGALRILGTSTSPVYLTSIKDDTIGADTNGDGTASSPAAGNWDRIEFQNSSDDAASLIDNAIIRYGGGSSHGSLRLLGASPTIQNSIFTRNSYGIYAKNSTPTFGCNQILENSGYGLYNATPALTVTVENQWWGKASGPYHPSLNPSGAANAVSDGVDFQPFRTAPCGTFLSQAANDGWVLESSETSGQGGTLNSTATTFYVGDDAADRQYRSVLSFNTSALPDDAIITKITLKIKLQGLVGSNPDDWLKVDIRKGPFGGNSALQTADFQASASLNDMGSLYSPTGNGWHIFEWTTGYSSLINKTGPTQFRLRFYNDDNDDRGADYLKFYSGNAAAAYRPQLLIQYDVP